MDHGDMGGMGGMGGMSPTASPMMMRRHKMMMHMTFFWGNNAEVLFDGWPGRNGGMYWLSLAFIFVLAFLTEWISHCRLLKPGTNNVAAGLVQTFMYAIRVGLNYLVMLAVMSFNGGVFLAGVAGYTLGFLFFGSRVFKKSSHPAKTSDLPAMHC